MVNKFEWTRYQGGLYMENTESCSQSCWHNLSLSLPKQQRATRSGSKVHSLTDIIMKKMFAFWDHTEWIRPNLHLFWGQHYSKPQTLNFQKQSSGQHPRLPTHVQLMFVEGANYSSQFLLVSWELQWVLPVAVMDSILWMYSRRLLTLASSIWSATVYGTCVITSSPSPWLHWA